MSETANPILSVQCLVSASAKQAFEAWTTAALAQQWWGGWEAGKAPEMQIEPVVGTPWRFAMSFDGKVQWVSGEITAVEAPGRLEFTFLWEGNDAPPSPVVVTFADVEGGCEVKLVHDMTLGGNACEEGWSWSLGCLASFFGAPADGK